MRAQRTVMRIAVIVPVLMACPAGQPQPATPVATPAPVTPVTPVTPAAPTKAEPEPVKTAPAVPADRFIPGAFDLGAAVTLLYRGEVAQPFTRSDERGDSVQYEHADVKSDVNDKVELQAHAIRRNGVDHQLVVYAEVDDYDPINVALFSAVPGGGWKLEYKKAPWIEQPGESLEEFPKPQVITIGPERYGLYYITPSVGCGAEDCDPEDDIKGPADRLFEVGDADVTLVLSTRDSGCVPEADRHPVAPVQCLYTFKPGSDPAHHDMTFTFTGTKKKPRTYVWKDGAYKPA